MNRLVQRAIHLAVLSSFALTQPLFDILSRNATFFAVRGSSSLEIVLFAVALTLLPPAVLVLAEVGAGLMSSRLANALHLVFVGGLAVLIAVQALKRWESLSSTVVLAGAAVLGAVAALLYRRAPFVRTFLTVLAPAPLVFLALFLGSSQISRLVFPEEEPVRTASVRSRTPVVFVIFDELSTISLMNRNQQIDAQRFPNFASLARDSTWYRSATTVHAHTEVAVPTILAGRAPKSDLLPIAADYPRNLFTFLGRNYRLQVVESLTHICPRSLCKTLVESPEGAGAGAGVGGSVSGSLRSLVSDLGIVYLHVLLPDRLADRVPAVDDRWGDFGAREKTESKPDGRASPAGPRSCARGFCGFTRAISNDRRPTLYFLHTLLPHVPWTYLPSGKRYTGNVRAIPGVEDARWRSDDWLTLQGYQRYLLQLAFTDRALGALLGRLRSTGLYDRALVVVTADHGVSFRPGEPRRDLTRGNFPDIAFMPLFVKLPGQRKGRVDDGLARTIDILPTVASVVRARIPWAVDGRSLVRARLPRDGTVSVPDANGEPVEAPLSRLLAERRRELRRQVDAFGTGSLAQVYRFGPHTGLVGRRLTDLSVAPASSARVELDGGRLLQAVELDAELVPSYLTGRIRGGRGEGEALAVAVNGVVAATTRSYGEFGEEKFAALVPEQALRAGANDVRIYAIRDGRLEQLRGSQPPTLKLQKRAGREVIESAGRARVRVEPGALSGEVRALTPGVNMIFGGWAVDVRARTPVESLVLFVDGRSVSVWPPTTKSEEALKRYRVGGAGFHFALPARLVPKAPQKGRVRVFAIRGELASELRYRGYYLRR